MITMLFQIGSEFANYVIGIILTITVPIIIFITGIYAMKWYAKKKRWFGSIKTAFIVNILLLIINYLACTFTSATLLDCVFISISCPDPYNAFYRQNEYFSVTYFICPGIANYSIHCRGHIFI